MQCKQRERASERGSALLIVFLFAAFVAIMLYEEMPVMAFEAQRAKEQLLVDRGNQYKQAVKVYWTHFQGRFPPDINGLENTNGIRFLRHRYKDPLTGKDDWRLLHMAPGGVALIDSKVNPAPIANQNTSTQNSTSTPGGAFGQSGFGRSSFGNNGASSSAFAGNSFGGQSANNTNSIAGPVGSSAGFNSPAGAAPGGPIVYAVPQRPPALAAGGAPGANGDPNDPNNLNNQNGGQMSASFAQQNPNGPPLALPGQAPQYPNGSSPTQPPAAVQQVYGMLASQGAPAQSIAPGGFNQPAGSTGSGSAFNSGSSTAAGGSTFHSAFSNSGLGGMLAGVASIAQGHGIKVIHDQHDYSKWEFWFNPQEVTTGTNGAAGATQNNQTPNNPANGNAQGIGASNTSNTFGNSGGIFSTNGNATTPVAPISPPQQQ
jgi:hypothetical protein